MLVVALEDTEDIVTELDDGFVGTATDDDEDANPVMSLDVEEIGVVGLSVLITKFELDDEVVLPFWDPIPGHTDTKRCQLE